MKEQKMIQVAYADDHISVRDGIANLISGYGTISMDILAANGRDLVRQLEMAKELPDICMIDINMPEMNGFETQLELMKRWPRIRTLIFTVYQSDMYIVQMIRNGANGYLLKNCGPLEIERALISIHQNGFYYPDTRTALFFKSIRNNEIKLPHFTEKEIQVLKHCCSDLSYVEIAAMMGTTSRSVEGYRDSLFKKLKVNSRASLVLCAVQFGIVPLDVDLPLDEIK